AGRGQAGAQAQGRPGGGEDGGRRPARPHRDRPRAHRRRRRLPDPLRADADVRRHQRPLIPESLGQAAAQLKPLAVLVRPAVDLLFRAPAWAGWALLGLGAASIALGRHGERVLLAALAGPLLAWLWSEAGFPLQGAPLRAALGAGAAAGALLPTWTR